MPDTYAIATTAFSAATLVVAVAILISVRRTNAVPPLTPEQLAVALRGECDHVRRDASEHARLARGEQSERLATFHTALVQQFGLLGESIDGKVRAFGGRLGEGMADMNGRVDALAQKLDRDLAKMGEDAHLGRDALRDTVDGKLGAHGSAQGEHARILREEVSANIRTLGKQVAATLVDMGIQQKDRLETTERAVRDLTERNAAAQETLRASVEGRLDAIRQENATKLEEMRATVDEKLQSTLEARLGESFTRVVEQLNRVHEGLGEMKNLASNVGDLKNVLTNVKVRGTYGEVQLALILEQFLAPHQYVKDARVNAATLERVEFAVRLPGNDAEVLLPIDAKFPRETYERLLEASSAGDTASVVQLRKEFVVQVKACAKTIRDKYVLPPATTDFAVMFLPTEGLYAEVLQTAGLCDTLQRDFRITVAGPTTLAALLSALQIGFRTLAIEKRSSEVWQILSAVKTEFGKYNAVVEGLSKQLNAAVGSVEKLGTRTRAMTRTLRGVHDLPDAATAEMLLKFEDDERSEERGGERADLPALPLRPPSASLSGGVLGKRAV